MLCKVIATPARVGSGMFKGWDFAPDDGRPLNVGELRFTYNPLLRESIEAKLKQARKDYKASIDEHWKQYKASKTALETTARMRAMFTEKETFLRELRELKHTSL